MTIKRKNKRSGNALIEFAIVTSLVLVPLLLGAAYIGVYLIAAIEVTQLTRDAGHMFARGVDFSTTQNKNMLLHLGSNMNITTSGGDGVVVLSQIKYLGATECPTGCTNINNAVFVRRLTVGNTSLYNSKFGDPGGVDGASGFVNDYRNNAGAVATGITALLSMQDGDEAFVAEGYLNKPNITIPPFISGATGVEARSIF
jgi:Flp pilus assembly protein TadG